MSERVGATREREAAEAVPVAEEPAAEAEPEPRRGGAAASAEPALRPVGGAAARLPPADGTRGLA